MQTLNRLLLAGAIALAASRTPASAQPPASRPAAAAENDLATPTGSDASGIVSYYRYVEPGTTSISIHGPKIGGEYTASFAVNKQRHWFVQADVRGLYGDTGYTGYCYPFLITPNNQSPNGWELDIGDSSPCSESGDRDWYIEGRGLVGKDIIGEKWGFAPYGGIGVRHLSNGTTGTSNYRTEDYLYVPLGLTARTMFASRRALSITAEVDVLLRGWNTTRDSQLGSGTVPATPIAPAFTIDGFTDISFSQHSGFAPRVSVKYQLTRMWSLEPYYIYWHVGASPVEFETVTFTVNGITAHEQRGAYEPTNYTHEVGVKVGIHF